MKFGSVCSGIEAASVAWEPLGMKAAWLSELDAFPSAVLAHRYPGVPNLGDMTAIPRQILTGGIEAPDVLVGGTPCFAAGHSVLCREGYKPIEDIVPGDAVVTHTGRLQRVLRTGSKTAEVGNLKAVGLPEGVTTTPDHPFLAVDYERKSTRKGGAPRRVEHCGSPEWVGARDLPGRNWCALTKVDVSAPGFPAANMGVDTVMYLAGMYLGDGYIRRWSGKSKKAVVLCLNPEKVDKLEQALPGRASYSTPKGRSIKATICCTALADWLSGVFGELSHAKTIPAWVMGHASRSQLLRGYLDTDGSKTGNGYNVNTVSRSLAHGVRTLAETLGYVSSVSSVKTAETCVIEGRTVAQRDYWSVRLFYAAASRKSRERHGYRLRRVQSYRPAGTTTVYNIEVEGDQSYILDGAAVHNCQSFSVAGMREGLADERGQLTIKYVETLDAIDTIRQRAGKPAAIAVWENVPGVLSDKSNAFGCLLGALAGEDGELHPSGKRWANAGCVYGPERAIAWRVLDAQYFGVAQRRRRVFVVASARTDVDPAAILFERESLRRDTPPSREAGEGFAADVAPSLTASGRGIDRVGESRGQDPVVATPYQRVSHCLNAGGMGRIDYETESFVCQAVTGSIAHTLNTANNGKGCSEDGTGRGVPTIAHTVSLRGRDGGATAEVGGDVATALRASSGGGDKPRVMTAHGAQDPICSDTVAHAPGLTTGGENTLFVPKLAVRRLTPVECERLQGFPDRWTDVPYRGKDSPADGNRYKAIGNSMAVPVMRWIGERIINALKESA